VATKRAPPPPPSLRSSYLHEAALAARQAGSWRPVKLARLCAISETRLGFIVITTYCFWHLNRCASGGLAGRSARWQPLALLAAERASFLSPSGALIYWLWPRLWRPRAGGRRTWPAPTVQFAAGARGEPPASRGARTWPPARRSNLFARPPQRAGRSAGAGRRAQGANEPASQPASQPVAACSSLGALRGASWRQI